MTKIINFDDLKKPAPVAIVIDGKKHDMKVASVDTFIANLKAIEGLGVAASPIQEIEVIVGIVHRAFPTLSEKQIRSWEITTIQALSDIARGVSGELVTDDKDAAEEAKASGNDQAAVQP